MSIIEIFGFASALLIGLILGLIGGGGSILSLPVLVYLLSVEPIIATTYSLFIVGATSLVGTLRYRNEKKINFKIGLLFTVPTLLTLYVTRHFILPAIPEVFGEINGFPIEKSDAIMVLFAVVMLMASYFMIKGRPDRTEALDQIKLTNLIFAGMGVGLLSGLVGAGGGFIIIPTLIYFAYLPVKNAIATSLFIIAINSLLGFAGDLFTYKMDWMLLLVFSFFSIVGVFIGIYLTRFIQGTYLKKAFGWFVLCMAIFILIKEFSA